MNAFLNPFFISRILKSYFFDLHRLRRIDPKKLKNFQDRNFRKMVKYAYSVPLYHEKYKKAGIHPSDIKGIEDIHKLPFISKEDIRREIPNNIVAPHFDKKNAIISYTSGTTGKPVSIYMDLYSITKALIGYLRVIKEHGINWRKKRITIIVDLSENSIESEYFIDGVLPRLRPFFSFDDVQIFNTYDNAKKLIEKIDGFQPECIVGYPGMLRQLAILKKKGYGTGIWPNYIISCGSILDDYLKDELEKIFESSVYDAYGAMESGPIAFQCKQGNYHIHSDLVYLEFVDHDNSPVSPGKPGRVVVTRLYGRGTPIIRYIGLDDIISTTREICGCEINSRLIRGIHGRVSQSIILPGGEIVLPSSLENFFGEVSSKVNIDKIERFQIVQREIDEIEIFAAVDTKIRDNDISLEKIFATVSNSFKEKYGLTVEVKVKEKRHFKPHTPGVISRVDKNKIKRKAYVLE